MTKQEFLIKNKKLNEEMMRAETREEHGRIDRLINELTDNYLASKKSPAAKAAKAAKEEANHQAMLIAG
jgi:hypothetical protein